MRDRLAACMVHAAATGAFNYAHADPYDKRWRLRHALLIREVARGLTISLLKDAHTHWLAYVSHSGLKEESWESVKRRAEELLTELKNTTYPWLAPEKTETETAEGTIYAKYKDLIDSYREMIAEKQGGAKKDE